MNALLLAAALFAADGVITERPVSISGQYLEYTVDPHRGGVISSLELTAEPGNRLHGGGLLQEGFGVASPYVPNRRLNQKLEVFDDGDGASHLVHSYDADGPNIRGLHVEKTIEPLNDRASVRVRWRVENRGDETQWVAPWVHNDAAPGGSVGPEDRVDVPSLHGVESVGSTGYRTASRNWIAVTDPAVKETLYAVFDANQLHSYENVREVDRQLLGFKALFVPTSIGPGESWETVFRIGYVRGLIHVDFATDELAGQMDYSNGQLKFLISSAERIADTEIHARALYDDGQVEELQAKHFATAPDALVRCTYTWRPKQPGTVDYLAQLRRREQPIELGADTHPPHGGFDTRIPIQSASNVRFEPWTDAPFAMDRQGTVHRRALAADWPAQIWFESSLRKVFRRDRVEATGERAPVLRVALAKNETESFQIVVRPPQREGIRGMGVRVHDFVHTETGAEFPTSAIEVRRVGYVPVRIGSHFENPTGFYPDPLIPFELIAVPGGECTPLWVTVHADANLPSGRYRGAIALRFSNADAVELPIEIEVYDFALPPKPAFRTSFGMDTQQFLEACRRRGFSGNLDSLIDSLDKSASGHRVTLRNLVPFPALDDQFPAAFSRYADRVTSTIKDHGTSASVPPELLSNDRYIARVDRWVAANRFQDTAFVHIAENPTGPDRSEALIRMRRWSEAAPNIPMMVSSMGLQPFFVDEAPIWTAHSRIFDTPNNQALLARIANGDQVWWYVNFDPPRPYANFFTDFRATEHRALFWQAWALGVRGMYYWSVASLPDGADPYAGDIVGAPVNGNGLLLYPGLDGPVESLRWEIIRDGIDDYDYLTLLLERTRDLKGKPRYTALLERASKALNLRTIVPDLTNFSREPEAYERRRREIAELITEIDRVAR